MSTSAAHAFGERSGGYTIDGKSSTIPTGRFTQEEFVGVLNARTAGEILGATVTFVHLGSKRQRKQKVFGIYADRLWVSNREGVVDCIRFDQISSIKLNDEYEDEK